MTQDKRDWKKENEQLNWLLTKATEGMQNEKTRADTAKELLLDTIGTMMAYDVPAVHINRAVKQFITLYPDTPAPAAPKESTLDQSID